MKKLLTTLFSISALSSSLGTVSCESLITQLTDGMNSQLTNLSDQNLDFSQICNLLENNTLDGKSLTFSNTIEDGVKLIQSVVGNKFFVRLADFNLAQNLINNSQTTIAVIIADLSTNQVNSKTIFVKIARISNSGGINSTFPAPSTLGGQSDSLNIENYVKSIYPNLTISDPSWVNSTLSAATIIAKINLTLGGNVIVEQASDLNRLLTKDTANISISVLIKEAKNQNNSANFTFNILIDAAARPEESSSEFFTYLKKFFYILTNSTADNINIDYDGSKYKMDVTNPTDIANDLSTKLPQDLIIYYNGNNQTISNGNDIYNSTVKIDLVFKDLSSTEHIVHFSVKNIKLNLVKIGGIIERDIQDDAMNNFHLGQSEDDVANYIESKMVSNSLYVTAPWHGVLSQQVFGGKVYVELNLSQKNNVDNILKNDAYQFDVRASTLNITDAYTKGGDYLTQYNKFIDLVNSNFNNLSHGLYDFIKIWNPNFGDDYVEAANSMFNKNWSANIFNSVLAAAGSRLKVQMLWQDWSTTVDIPKQQQLTNWQVAKDNIKRAHRTMNSDYWKWYDMTYLFNFIFYDPYDASNKSDEFSVIYYWKY